MTEQQQQLQDRKDGLDLLEGISHDGTRNAILHNFESKLSEYLESLLSAQIGDAEALHIRAKAMGLVEVMLDMGVKISRIADLVPIKRVAGAMARQSLNLQ